MRIAKFPGSVLNLLCNTPCFVGVCVPACLLAFCVVALGGAQTGFGQSLHEKIDAAIASKAGGELAPLASDSEFVRRVYLDLAGIVPTADQASSFLADKDAAKREKLIDKLLAAPEYGRRMQEAISTMLLERRTGSSIKDEEWNEFLREAFNSNEPWHELTQDILFADDDKEIKPAKKFFEVRGRAKDPHQKTQDVARLFLGRNMKCAQCHDHPSVMDYKQAEYYGIFSYVQDKPEKAKSEFESVFIPGKHETFPRLPGMDEVSIPTFTKKQAKEAKEFRPRLLLARDLPTKENELFKRNSVNRFWFLMFGRGIVNPLDLMHEENPPSHPKLLATLADDFANHDFDVKYLIREITLSQTYQRGSVLPEGAAEEEILPASYRVFTPKGLTPEQMAWSLMRATENLTALKKVPVPEETEFGWYNYTNGKIGPPTNVPDILNLFAGVFGNPPGEAEEEFTPSMGDALFLMNERLVLEWLQPKDGNLVGRVSKLTKPAEIAEQLSLAIYARSASEVEKELAAEHLEANAETRDQAIIDLAWAMLTADEFRMNH